MSALGQNPEPKTSKPEIPNPQTQNHITLPGPLRWHGSFRAVQNPPMTHQLGHLGEIEDNCGQKQNNENLSKSWVVLGTFYDDREDVANREHLGGKNRHQRENAQVAANMLASRKLTWNPKCNPFQKPYTP